jgi:hypothetical protein
MVRMQDEQQVQGPGSHLADLIFLRGHREHHVEESLAEAQRILWIDDRPTHVMPVACRRDGRHFRNHALGGKHALFRVVHVQAVVIESRQRADDPRHHRHRVGVVVEAGNEGIELVVDHRVVGQLVTKMVQLVLGRQLTVQQQVGHLDKGASLGQLLDRITAVAQDPLTAVNKGYFTGARSCRCKARVISEVPERRGQRLYVDRRLALRADKHG